MEICKNLPPSVCLVTGNERLNHHLVMALCTAGKMGPFSGILSQYVISMDQPVLCGKMHYFVMGF